jgi:POT family proton-dependent oligopeptide transporter
MGAWFLATAFSQYLAGVISQFTSVSSVEGFPPPSETVNVYGEVFKSIAITAMLCGLVCIVISPILNKWMHTDKFDSDKEPKPKN